MKLFGSIMIILASIISSALYEKKLKQEINDIEELIRFTGYIKNQIEYFSLPVDKIFKNYNKSQFINHLIANKQSCLSDNIPNKNIEYETKLFLNNLGKGFKKEQLALCNYFIQKLESAKNELQTEFSKKTKIYRSLSLFAGIACVILIV